MAQEDLIAAWSIKRGCRAKFDVDCSSFLTGGATMTAFVITPPDGCPLVFEAVTFVASGTVAQFYASAPDAAAFGHYLCEAKATHSGGESDKQYFQMRVE